MVSASLCLHLTTVTSQWKVDASLSVTLAKLSSLRLVTYIFALTALYAVDMEGILTEMRTGVHLKRQMKEEQKAFKANIGRR